MFTLIMFVVIGVVLTTDKFAFFFFLIYISKFVKIFPQKLLLFCLQSTPDK